MSKRDYYEILGVQRGAGADELKRAFRQKAKTLHPDRNRDDTDAEVRFKELNEAYDVLKDPQKKAAYDRFGHAAFENGMGGGGGPRGATGAEYSSFADVFEDIFGDFMGGGRPGGRGRGADLRYNLDVTLEEAFHGRQATIEVPGAAPCESCNGTGGEGGAQPTVCGTCNGAGRVRAQQGFFSIERTCATCGGQGRVVEDPCRTCAGSGHVRRQRTLQVNIPRGVEEGTRIRLTGEGEPGPRGGAAGDLYIFVRIKPHPLFERDGADLHCRIPISMATAALGGAIEAPLIGGGRARLTVPEGCQSGKQFRLSGKGMPTLRGGVVGDLFVEVSVETPVNLTRRQRELLKEFERESHADNSPQSEGFFKRVKDFWEELAGGRE